MPVRITVFGLGEAGSGIAADLAAAGIPVNGYDPAPTPTPPGVLRFDDPRTAVVGADLVIALTAATDARTALTQALLQIPVNAIYADFSTNTAAAKQELAKLATSRGLPFVDVALMSTVPGKGLRTPALASGNGVVEFVRILGGHGMPVTRISEIPGDAAIRKLLRSVVIKGLAGTIIEAMRAAEQAGCADWLWSNLAEEITRADAAFLSRLVRGTGQHAARRLHEMEASRDLLVELGIDPVMTRATVENLRRVPEKGLPDIPALPD
jgi:3-hydroxyisobutyrate dehydrogenase-like beta-hydroxyacid dehydrogenase